MAVLSGLSRLIGRGTRSETKAVTLTDPLALALFGIPSTASGITVTAASAMRVPAVSAAVGLIAEAVGTMPCKVYARSDKAVLADHPAHRLTHRMANPWTSATDLRTILTTDALLTGHGYALVVRNGLGLPLELHRLDPSAVTREETDAGEPVFRVRYKDGGDRLHGYGDVLHIEAFGGVSPIHLAREAIALSIAAEMHLSGYFRNGGRPSGVIRHPAKLDVESLKKIAASWFVNHGGEKAGSTAVLDEGMDYVPVVGSHADAEFHANRVEQIREIARAFRVPPPLLMELSRATWSNAEEMGRQFLTLTLRPWLAKWESAYERALLSPAEQAECYVEFVADDLLSVDSAKRATALSQYRAAGVMTANEARAALNLTPRPDGDELVNPFTTSAHAPASDSTPTKEPTE